MYYSKDDKNYTDRMKEWNAIEDAVFEFQKQFNQEEVSQEQLLKSKEAGNLLIEKFNPLINKYLILLTTGQINWDDKETKSFVSRFIPKEEKELISALKRKKQKSMYRKEIYKNFNFIKETYGSIPKNEIRSDLQTFLLTLAKRYRYKGKNFCGYVYNSYKHEVCRHIKKFIKNPININYKNLEYQDYINGELDPNIEHAKEDTYESFTGIPNINWITGDESSEIFDGISQLDRRILIKYYLEEWKDKQIAEHFGLHINTINQRRRKATKKIAENINIDISAIKRTRRSGKKAVLPTSILR